MKQQRVDCRGVQDPVVHGMLLAHQAPLVLEGDAVEADNGRAEIALYELQFLNKLLIAADHLEEKLLDY